MTSAVHRHALDRQCPVKASLVPDPLDSEDQQRRFRHLDLEYLSSRELWAERRLIANALAQMVFDRQDAWIGCGSEAMRVSDWFVDRQQQLGKEIERRRMRA